MKSKSLFSLSLLLLFAGIVSLMGTPTDVQAQLSIDSIRIYVNPDMVAPENDNTPDNFNDGWIPSNNFDGQIAAIDDFEAGTLQGGILIDESNAHSAGADAFTANAGDIIAIAFRLQEAGTETRMVSHINLAFNTIGRPHSPHVFNGQSYRNTQGPSRFLQTSGGAKVTVTAGTYFTAVYLYQVRSGDIDANGDWISRRPGTSGRNNDGPFIRYDGPPLVEIPASATVHYPRIDGSVSTIPQVTRLTINRPPAGQSGPSRYYKVRQECLDHQRKYGDVYTNACELVQDHGWALPNDPTHPVTLANSLPTAFFKAGDTIEFQLQFSEEVIVTGAPILELMLDGGTGRMHYVPGSGSTTLTFRYTVQQGDTAFGGIAAWNAWGNIRDGNSIEDMSGHKVNSVTRDVESAIRAFFAGQEGIRAEEAHPWLDPPGAHWKKYATGIAEYLVDTVPPTVWIPGLIKNGETHTDDRRNAFVSVEPTYLAVPTFTEADLRASITESESQTDAFDVEFRFFNWDGGALADEVGISFTGDDVEITGANVERADWAVETTYIGLDHRATNQWPPTDRAGQPAGSAHKPGHAKNSASFLVYKATIRPALGFQGNVSISLPAGATQDIAGNDSYASNTLTVPVNNPLRVVEKPEIVVPPAGVHTAGDKIEVEVTYDKENLRYEGDNPPYLTLYLGEEVPANARHAIWVASEDTNSTKVTFAYTVAATDTVAEAVRVPSVKISVPEETTLLSGPLTAPDERQSGTEESAAASGTAPKTVPVIEPLPEVSPVVSDTPVVPVYPIFEEAAPKAAASDVPRSPIVFNELGNGSGDADDWLELRNVTGTAVSLKDWELSIVQDGKKEDTSLIAFVEDVSVPANGLLLITNSDPTAKGNGLAGGDNVATAEVETKGSSHLYFVKSELSLPDDGKFLLILRNATEKLGLNEAFVDVAGGGGSDTDAFVREQTGDYDTHVWPLQVLQAPGGDTEDALGSGKVWQRAKADIVGYHKDAWAESAFTGIGYDRKVSASAEMAGTPGYPNGAVKPGSATPKGSITFSEIMVDSGGRTLPQWIELYNNSKTDAINLNRWELEIQNVDSEDLVGRPIVTLTLGEKVIQPNQTLLIVAGPARASSDSYLPADRVYDLLALHEKNLRIKSARDTFLSTEGFYLQLSDRNGNLVDEVGNRDSDRRSDDAPAWALPLSFEEGSRSSLIRRYDKGVALPGRKRASWVLAARIKPFDESLHYGHADDIGTPGHREGGALPVELSSFSLTRTEAGAVVLTWTTESEVDNAGFNLRRSEKRASGFTLLNPALIAGAGTTGERQTYTFTDTSAKPGVEYYYQIEEVAFDGKRETLVTRLLPGPVSASNRMLTTFGEVKQQE